MDKSSILMTGGAGYIGRHLAASLLQEGYNVILFDNLSNAYQEVIEQILRVVQKKPILIEGDLLNKNLLIQTFKKYQVKTVIHLAASKSIADSMQNPIHYYENNVSGSLSLFAAMEACGITSIIFSSSSAVYGEVEHCPIHENQSTTPVNPYGLSKIFVEDILKDIANSHLKWQVMIFRLFNVVGAHDSGILQENPKAQASNIFLMMRNVILGNTSYLPIYGSDYLTPDGTAIRDYIHVSDIVQAHVKALQWMKNNPSTHTTMNLGSGKGFSVLEIVQAFEKCLGRNICYQIRPRRPGDVPASYASIEKAHKILNWKPQYHLSEMCSSYIQSLSNGGI